MWSEWQRCVEGCSWVLSSLWVHKGRWADNLKFPVGKHRQHTIGLWRRERHAASRTPYSRGWMLCFWSLNCGWLHRLPWFPRTQIVPWFFLPFLVLQLTRLGAFVLWVQRVLELQKGRQDLQISLQPGPGNTGLSSGPALSKSILLTNNLENLHAWFMWTWQTLWTQ